MAADYTTIQGDTWDGIAFRLWKNEKLFNLLVRENEQYAGIAVFPAGIRISVPDVETQRTIAKNLPPWME